jgi:hypothetical protein
MSRGLSFKSFAGKIGCSAETLYKFLDTHADFEEAKAVGEGKLRMFWEQMGVAGAMGLRTFKDSSGANVQLGAFSATAWMVNMFNRFRDDWKRWGRKEEEGSSDRDDLRGIMSVLARAMVSNPGKSVGVSGNPSVENEQHPIPGGARVAP